METRMLHQYCAATPLDWTKVVAYFYIQGSGHDVVTTPRERLAPGIDLFEGLDSLSGWTAFGSCRVESVDGDTVVTSRGTITTQYNISIEKSNVMPYADGGVTISLESDFLKVTIPATDSLPERSLLVDPKAWAMAKRGELLGAKKILEALLAQLPDAEDLIIPYMEFVDTVEAAREWKDLEVIVDIAGTDIAPRIRVRAVFSRYDITHVDRSAYDSDDRTFNFATPYKPCHIWQLSSIEEDGTLRDIPYAHPLQRILLDSLPYIDYGIIGKKSLPLSLSYGFKSEEMKENGKVELHVDIPYTYSFDNNGLKYQITLALRSESVKAPTTVSRLISRLRNASDPTEIRETLQELSYCKTPEQKYEYAVWRMTNNGRKFMDNAAQTLGYIPGNSLLSDLDNLRFSEHPAALLCHRLYAEELERQNSPEAARAFAYAAKTYREASDSATADLMDEKSNALRND